MGTLKEVAAILGISPRTITNQKKDGYSVVTGDGGKIDVEKSVHAYVKFQSEKIRHMNAQKGRDSSENIGNRKEPETAEDWKTEKEKQGAIKLQLQNEKDIGEVVPVDAILELYNQPLSYVKGQLLDLSNQISKRLPLDPGDQKTIDDLVRDALEGLNEKGADELQSIITPIIERYSKYYRSSEEDGDSYLDD